MFLVLEILLFYIFFESILLELLSKENTRFAGQHIAGNDAWTSLVGTSSMVFDPTITGLSGDDDKYSYLQEMAEFVKHPVPRLPVNIQTRKKYGASKGQEAFDWLIVCGEARYKFRLVSKSCHHHLLFTWTGVSMESGLCFQPHLRNSIHI